MAYTPKPGDGTLFKNNKGTSDKAPSHTGHITAHRDIKKGEKLRLAAWLKGGEGGTDGGMGVKPSDRFVIPLCSAAHREQHNVGEAEFQRMYGVNMRKIADSLWAKSPHGIKWRAEHQ